MPTIAQQPQLQRQNFIGTGYTLGSESQPSQRIVPHETQPTPMGPVQRQLSIWRNGFTIDDGPLYPFSDPESVEILREIRMGRVPRNVAGAQLGQDVEMRLVNRENEEWTPPQPRAGAGQRSGAFIGLGNRLGRLFFSCRE